MAKPMIIFHRIPIEFIATELLYTLIVIALCLVIYFRTKEIYDLTKKRSVYFFRNTFLLFALAFFFRILQLLFPLLGIHIPLLQRFIWMALVMYFSTMAIFSLTYSIIWKKIKKTKFWNWGLHVIAVLFTVFVIITGNIDMLILAQLLMFIIAIVLSYTQKISKMRIVYVLLFCFWILNLLPVGRMINPLLKLPSYLFSILIFWYIEHKVMRATNAKKR